MQKALDYTKLKASHAQGKLLKKQLRFPVLAGIKYDGHYTVVKVKDNVPEFISSGGHTYDNNSDTIFHFAPDGVYIAERINMYGKLGERKDCALRGPRGRQTAYNALYMAHDYMTHEEYEAGITKKGYRDRLEELNNKLRTGIVKSIIINNEDELDHYLDTIVLIGYEGLMLKQEDWIWKRTKSRTIDLVKYKKRPTVDLEVIGTEEGEGKYEGMIGALVCRDSRKRIVSVGSGLLDADRFKDPDYYIGKVVEVEYEQIMGTYIQPTYKGIREDKTVEEID